MYVVLQQICFKPYFLSPPSAPYMHQWIGSAMVQIMACRLFGTKPLSKPMLGYFQLVRQEQTSVKFWSKIELFHSRKCVGKYRLRNDGHFVQEKMSQVSQFHSPISTMLLAAEDRPHRQISRVNIISNLVYCSRQSNLHWNKIDEIFCRRLHFKLAKRQNSGGARDENFISTTAFMAL